MTNREIDALIAEHVFGWKKILFTPEMNIPTYCKESGFTWMWDKKEGCLWHERQLTPFYSTNITEAFRVVEEVCKKDLYDHTLTTAVFSGDVEYLSTFEKEGSTFYNREHDWEKTAPMAICLAALKTVGIKI